MINWGILGTSFISGVMAEAIARAPGHRLYAAAGRSAAGLASFGEKYAPQRLFNDYARLITDPEVDVVYIALPNHIHHDFVMQAARAGKAILCEKSLSVDMPRTEAALAAVEEHRVFFMEGLMYLHHPLIVALIDILNGGELGEVRSLTARYGASIAHLVNPDSRGAIYNLGCYPASLAHLVMQHRLGDAVGDYRLAAMGRRGADGNLAEATAILSWADGAVASLHCTEDYGMFWDFSIQGSVGSLRIESNPWLPEAGGNRIVVTPYEGETRYIDIAAAGDAFDYQVLAVGSALAQGAREVARPAARAEDSLAIMRMLTTWEQGAEAGLV
ncbi:Gfo/Idh/MocA family protein [Raoultella terrigena]|uniref:Gfo/Idh/MocA family protein n=1 Tax=Raoultella terrigena TaxID=577 RepID=UPI00349F7049